MKRLAIQLSKLWKDLIIGFNKHLQERWILLYEESFIEWKKGKKTQEITKAVSLVFTSYLKKRIESTGLVLIECDGFDFKWEGIPIEGKLTLSKGNSWTGNGFPKTNWHLLVKIQFDDNGQISGSLVCLVPLDECKSSWTKTSNTNNFSSLKLLSEDYEKIIMVVGNFKKNPIYLSPILV